MPDSFRRPIQTIVALVSMALLLTYGLPTAYANHLQTGPLIVLPGSAARWIAGAQYVGHHNASDKMTIAVVLQTRNQAEQLSILKALYNPSSSSYHQWLKTGVFDARYAPTSDQVAAVKNFLSQAHLQLIPGASSARMLVAEGTVSQVQNAFHTQIDDYSLAGGQIYYANTTSALLPASLKDTIVAVLGLSNVPSKKSYDTVGEKKPNLPPPYGGGPFGRGLTPSQISGIYNADPVYKELHDRGQGTSLAVFELSGYTQSDIDVYEKTFHLRNVPLKNRLIFGGATDHSGASEVELDIELEIAMAPGAESLFVYQAPNTNLGSDAEFLKIAQDNQADVISTSWAAACDFFTSTQDIQVENQAFVQMALQGQSLFNASGDDGAFGCTGAGVSLPLPEALQVGDPAGQPYITSVGGTSFRQGGDGAFNFDPGKNMHPTYPPLPAETVWIDVCTPSSCPGGAGGGGISRFWGSPDYFFDSTGAPRPGVVESTSQVGAFCNQQPGVLCRETPDVSLDADPDTGYAIYCTDPGDSFCTDPGFSIQGWVRIGGTSCSSPVWAGIAALDDTFHDGRLGLFNYIVYQYDSPAGYSSQFHDIRTGNNGFYPADPTFDMSTGIGSPDVFHFIKP